MGRSFFHTSLGNRGDLGNGIEYWSGYYQSLRPTQMGLSLNIGRYLDCSVCVATVFLMFRFEVLLDFFHFWFCFADVSARSFYEPILVSEFVAKHLRRSNLSKPLSDQDRIKVLLHTVFLPYVHIEFSLYQSNLLNFFAMLLLPYFFLGEKGFEGSKS